MIIQYASRLTPDTQTAGRVSDDASRVSATASSAKANRGVAVELPQSGTQPIAPQQASSEELKEAVKDINRAMQQSNRNLEFSVDADTSKLVVKLTDTETGELIRQIPSEETLAISRSLGEFQQGLLLKQKV